MALINLQQTDTAATCSFANFCDGGPDAATPTATDARSGGTPGTGTPAVTVNTGQTNHAGVLLVSNAIGQTTWGAGTYTVRYNVTTPAANMTITEVRICRVNSSCVSQEDLGALTALARDISGTGIQTFVVTGAAATALTGDKVAVVISFGNSHGHNDRTHNYTANQIIDTPIDDGVGGGRRRAHAA